MARWNNFVSQCAKSFAKRPTPSQLKTLRTHIQTQVGPKDAKEALSYFDSLISQPSVSGSFVSGDTTVGGRSVTSSVAPSRMSIIMQSAVSSAVVPPKETKEDRDDDDDIFDFDNLSETNEEQAEDEISEEESDPESSLGDHQIRQLTDKKYDEYCETIQGKQDASRRARKNRSIYNKISKRNKR